MDDRLRWILNGLNTYNVNKLVEQIDKDWFLDNQNMILGISNRRFLCNYIEDNMNKNTPLSPPLMRNEYIQDILQVYRLDFMKLKKPDFSKVQRLPENYEKKYYALIGRIDNLRWFSMLEFLEHISFYRMIIMETFNDYEVEFTDYRIYSLTILLATNTGADLIDLKMTSLYKNQLNILVDYATQYRTGMGSFDGYLRVLVIMTLLQDDLEGFKKINDGANLRNVIPAAYTEFSTLLNYDVGPATELINTYCKNLMALICAMGKLEFLKHLISIWDPDDNYKIVYMKAHCEDTFSTKYGDAGIPIVKRATSWVPNTFETSDGTPETYLSICLKNKQYATARFLIDRYPIEANGYYDILIDINLTGRYYDFTMYNKYTELIKLNRSLIKEITKPEFGDRYDYTSSDQVKTLVERGANPNLFYYRGWNENGPILHYAIVRNIGTAELLIQVGADVNFKSLWGRTSIFHIHSVKIFDLCKKYGADFKIVDYGDDSPLTGVITSQQYDLAELMINEGADLNQRDKKEHLSPVFTRLIHFPDTFQNTDPDLLSIVKRTNLSILSKDGRDLYDHYSNVNAVYMKNYISSIGVRGIQAYKKPMFYLPKKNSDCPNKETVGFVDVDDPEDDLILMFRDFGYSDVTHRHKQELMCVALSEINEIYFILRPGTEEFEWNLPTTRATHRLGRDQVGDVEVIRNLLSSLSWFNTQIPDTDPRKNKLTENTRILDANFKKYYQSSSDYYKQNIALFKSLNENQLKLLETLMLMVFKLGEFMRRWGGDEETTMKLYGKAENFPYPMHLLGPDLIKMSDGTTVGLLDAYSKHILIRSRDYPRDKPEGIVPYAEDISAEQLSVIDHFVNNYFSVKDNEDVLNYETYEIQDLLKFIRNKTRLDLRILLIEIDHDLPIPDILRNIEDGTISKINLTVDKVREHIRKRILEITPLEKFYKNIYEYTMSSQDLSIITTNRRIYHTLDAIRPKRDGSIDEAALGDCIQLKGQDFILTGYMYFDTFVPDYVIPGFSIEGFRPMHY